MLFIRYIRANKFNLIMMMMMTTTTMVMMMMMVVVVVVVNGKRTQIVPAVTTFR